MRVEVKSVDEVISLARAVHSNLPESMEGPLVESLEFLLTAIIVTKDPSIYPEYLHHNAVCQLLQSKIDSLKSTFLGVKINQKLEMIADLYQYEHCVLNLDYPEVISNMMIRYKSLFEGGLGYLYLFGQPDYSDSIYVHDFESDLPDWLRMVFIATKK